MSVRHAIFRGLELGRSVLQRGLLKPAVRVAAKLRGERVGPAARTVQPRPFLPARYRYYRSSLRGLAAQLQAAAFRRRFPRNRAVFLAFGLGVGLIEQQLEDDRKTAATCQDIQVIKLQYLCTVCDTCTSHEYPHFTLLCPCTSLCITDCTSAQLNINYLFSYNFY